MARWHKVLFSLSLFYSFSFLSADQEIIYQTSSQGVVTKTNWKIEEKQSKLFISGKNKGKDVFIECSLGYSLLNFSEKDDGKEFSITRKGDVLTVQSAKGKTKTYTVGETPWVQEFKFGFQPFLISSDREYKFCIVNPKDLGLHNMVATKESEEMLTIAGQTYQAQKIKVTLQGFKKKFWKAEVWFDIKTQLLVKYKANEGPGTPMTELTLLPN